MVGRIRVGIVLFTIATGAFACAHAQPAIALSAPSERLVQVTGTATINVVPDEAVLTLGVETVDKDINKAQSENAGRVKDVFQVAKEHGIEERDIQTAHVSITPEYRHENQTEVFIGYKVQQTIALTLRDLSVYESLLTDLLKAGVTSVANVEFRTSKLREHKDEARLQAAKAAREKAAALAGALGARIGRVHTIIENGTNWYSSYAWAGNRAYWGSNMMMSAQAGGGATGGEESIAPGELRITASVSVSFELE